MIFVSPSINYNETVPIIFNFLGKLQYGETITAAGATCTLWTGTDSNPSAMLSGTPIATPTIVTQNITGGIVGNIYILTCAVTASNQHNYLISTKIAVITPGGLYQAI